MITPRWYQQEAIDAGVEYFNCRKDINAIEILPTGSGKSVVIANIAAKLPGEVLVLQPSKEILIQNFQKYTRYGFRAGIYSASAGHKFVDKVTFGMIGSINNKHHVFRNVKHIIVDECHLVNSKGGMYQRFIDTIGAKTLGLTATPYRLVSGFEGAELRFLTRTSPRIFNRVEYLVQNEVLFKEGHLAKLEYFAFNIIDRTRLEMNSGGTDFTEASMRAYYRSISFEERVIEYGNELLKQRKNMLVFCSLIEEAKKVCAGIPGSVIVTGETEQQTRDRILAQFKSGTIKCVINVGVLTTGFDYPELETILLARSTMSLALYYQIVGRAMRPHPAKESAWIVDLGGNIDYFGKIETMHVGKTKKGLWAVFNNGKQLTNVKFVKK